MPVPFFPQIIDVPVSFLWWIRERGLMGSRVVSESEQERFHWNEFERTKPDDARETKTTVAHDARVGRVLKKLDGAVMNCKLNMVYKMALSWWKYWRGGRLLFQETRATWV